ncbi:MAG: acyl-ACP--UDP-N-acetylglucosamine O-acyltransferase [Bacteroidales bacterium]|nr:acyl-ACP--UDP-N-acetylglucosamine O-acyltransferase [Bacteroidales bacterium]MDD4030581.1 acyl-ACP--UDP-N-acetylglucosamine O-acyltransferase [Bacteroidales bacterium]MDD4435682.1 acyl-ACP--UDP-N-acetylglucosamine O-acyltransferase [Bacteroidales bacterium]MDD5733772.1 acyl-ACP--UDP-N-acetylglucosamine O-acyltransferase [Bacteroidales bacterium]
MIHKFSVVHPKAKLGKDVEIGPFSTIAQHVEIGPGTVIGPNVTIMDYVRIGNNCRIFPGAVIGAIPQDLKFAGEVSSVEIGDNVTIREYATINRGTAASHIGVTKVDDNCLIMSYVHIAHDCHIKNNVILTSYVGLAGETHIDEYAIIGGASAAHQFTRIGTHAMVSGGSMIGKDVPPYVLAGRRPLCYGGINIIGLRRRGFTSEQIERIHDIYRIIYQVGLNISDACRKVEEVLEVSEEKNTILSFIRASQRGIIPYKAKFMEEE